MTKVALTADDNKRIIIPDDPEHRTLAIGHWQTKHPVLYKVEINANELFKKGTLMNLFYNIAFVNSQRLLAKSRVDITLRQHGKFPPTLLLKFFVLYYKRNIKHFFCIDIQLYQHS